MPPKKLKVFLPKTIQKQLGKIDIRYRQRIFKVFQKLENDPLAAGDIKKIRGEINSYRCRIGDYRIIYEIEWTDHRIFILGIFPRGQAYK